MSPLVSLQEWQAYMNGPCRMAGEVDNAQDIMATLSQVFDDHNAQRGAALALDHMWRRISPYIEQCPRGEVFGQANIMSIQHQFIADELIAP